MARRSTSDRAYDAQSPAPIPSEAGHFFFSEKRGTMIDVMGQEQWSKREEEILAFWKRERVFEQSVERDAPNGEFVFYEGPPTANAPPGIHHVEARTFKDIIPRYKTMRGYRVRRKAGWDTHGLPVELQLEKKLGLKAKRDVETYGIAAFNAACRDSVWEFKREWERLTERIGFWLDQRNPYVTYEMSYVESVWWFLRQAWEKGLLVRDYKVVPWCPRCETPLSSHEVALGYERVTERSVYLKFALADELGTFILAWTTTPWTLPGNVALAVDPNVRYAKVRAGNGERYYLAEALVGKLREGDRTVEATVLGSALVGRAYRPLFNFVDLRKGAGTRAYEVVAADFVTTGDGTGVVHTAVMYGDDDFRLGTALGLPKQHTVREDGTFNELVPPWTGRYVKAPETEQAIVDWLIEHGLLYAEEQYAHDYPFCWRCHTPLLYYARRAWYIAMAKLRQEIQAKNATIHWFPDHIRDGRFGEWLRELKDWAITRERYWGAPIPIWECDRCGEREIIGSFAELIAKVPKRNRFLLMRHGEAESNVHGVISSKIETSDQYPLTAEGRARVVAAAERLKGAGITRIIASPYHRIRETAAIVSQAIGVPVTYDERLREIDLPDFDGKPCRAHSEMFASDPRQQTLEKFTKKIGENETWSELAARMLLALRDIDRQHEGETILICSHGDPIFLLEWAFSGRTRDGIAAMPYPAFDAPHAFAFTGALVNDRGELDVHRPFIDQITWPCAQGSCGGTMEHFPEVVDVWLESGCMPFAQHHFPFEKKEELLYPADYISEAIDQTRGWFYTLLAVATVLGWESPYKNVIVLGHLLDAKGLKMSKSKGNVVNPITMIDRYGADIVRWYMVAVNQPWDAKLFNEEDLTLMSRKPFGTLMNLLSFWQLHGGNAVARWPDNSSPSPQWGEGGQGGERWSDPGALLDHWLRARVAATHVEVTQRLDAYELTEAARAIGDLVDDLSTWWLRRSRERLRAGKQTVSPHPLGGGARGGGEAPDAAATFTAALRAIAVLLAPFAPFTAEHFFRSLPLPSGGGGGVGGGEEDVRSVHLAAWDTAAPPAADGDANLLQYMGDVRHLCSLGLEARAKANIPVRQPLASISIPAVIARSPKGDVAISRVATDDVHPLLQLIADELNVREVVIDPSLKDSVSLDTTLTPTLKREGMIRELTRAVNNLRKEMGLTPTDRIRVTYETDDAELAQAIVEQQAQIERATASVFSPSLRGGARGGADKQSVLTIASAQITIDIVREV